MFVIVSTMSQDLICEPLCFVLGSLLALLGMQLVLSFLHGSALERLKNVITNHLSVYVRRDTILVLKYRSQNDGFLLWFLQLLNIAVPRLYSSVCGTMNNELHAKLCKTFCIHI